MQNKTLLDSEPPTTPTTLTLTLTLGRAVQNTRLLEMEQYLADRELLATAEAVGERLADSVPPTPAKGDISDKIKASAVEKCQGRAMGEDSYAGLKGGFLNKRKKDPACPGQFHSF